MRTPLAKLRLQLFYEKGELPEQGSLAELAVITYLDLRRRQHLDTLVLLSSVMAPSARPEALRKAYEGVFGLLDDQSLEEEMTQRAEELRAWVNMGPIGVQRERSLEDIRREQTLAQRDQTTSVALASLMNGMEVRDGLLVPRAPAPPRTEP